MNSVKRKIKYVIFIARPAKRNNLPSNITSFFGNWSEMEYSERFILWDLFMRNSSNCFWFFEVKVSANQNTSLWKGKKAVNWEWLLESVLPCPITLTWWYSWGEGWEMVLWTSCPPGKVPLAPKLCVCSLRTLPALFWNDFAYVVCLLPPPDCERYLEYFKGISWFKNSRKWLHSLWTYCSYAGWIVLCMHNKLNVLGACQTLCMCYAASAPFIVVQKTGD